MTSPLIRAIKTIPQYRKEIKYLLKKGGVSRAYDFLFTKTFVDHEGGDVCILNPFFRQFPEMLEYPTFPYRIEVEHTTQCDKKCILCEHTYWGEKEKGKRLTFKEAKKIIDEFPNLRYINITGEGSGFLNPDFLKILRYLRSKNVSVNFVDEFEYINRERARKLIKLGVNTIFCSMDGATKETYESIKVGCNFDKVIKNLRQFKELKEKLNSPLPTVSFRFIVNKRNFREMPKFIELVHSLGVMGAGSRIEFAGVLKFDEIAHLYLEEVPPPILDETKRKARKLGVPIKFAHLGKETIRPLSTCVAWVEPYIMMKGYVLPCCSVLMSNKRSYLREHSFGNIFEESFEEIWNSERYKKFRSLVLQKKGKVPLLCKGCRGFDTSVRKKKYGVTENI